MLYFPIMRTAMTLNHAVSPGEMSPMPFLPEKMPKPEEEELERKKASLADLEAQLADRELELG